MNRKLELFAIALAVVLGAETLAAQGPGRPPNMQNRGGQMRQQAFNNNANGPAMTRQNVRDTAQLAQRMLANYDADASGELSQSELQLALEGLRQLIAQNMQAAQMTGATQHDQRSVQSRMQTHANGGGDRRPPVGAQRGKRGR